MKIIDTLKNRRTYYDINRELSIDEKEIIDLVEELTELVPDSFNMKSSRVVLVLGRKQDELWDRIYDAFEGKVPRDKIDSFKKGYGTILYFIDGKIVREAQKDFPNYKDNFPIWANQSSGMLQLSIWTGLREKGIGASLQHYNPVIDDVVKDQFNLPEDYDLVAQMPFGAIGSEPSPKEKEDISLRVRIEK